MFLRKYSFVYEKNQFQSEQKLFAFSETPEFDEKLQFSFGYIIIRTLHIKYSSHIHRIAVQN